jgi:hypothetical protein
MLNRWTTDFKGITALGWFSYSILLLSYKRKYFVSSSKRLLAAASKLAVTSNSFRHNRYTVLSESHPSDRQCLQRGISYLIPSCIYGILLWILFSYSLFFPSIYPFLLWQTPLFHSRWFYCCVRYKPVTWQPEFTVGMQLIIYIGGLLSCTKIRTLVTIIFQIIITQTLNNLMGVWTNTLNHAIDNCWQS